MMGISKHNLHISVDQCYQITFYEPLIVRNNKVPIVFVCLLKRAVLKCVSCRENDLML